MYIADIAISFGRHNREGSAFFQRIVATINSQSTICLVVEAYKSKTKVEYTWKDNGVKGAAAYIVGQSQSWEEVEMFKKSNGEFWPSGRWG